MNSAPAAQRIEIWPIDRLVFYARNPRKNDSAEAGFLHAGGFGAVDFSQIPDGLNAGEVETFVRKNGARICGSRRAEQHPMQPVLNVVLDRA